jgi:peptidoglycan/LPS O-acetylase OafA/YrhL
LPLGVAFVITFGLKREGDLVPILLFFIFVVLVCVCTLALGYGLSSFEERTISRRCRMPHEAYRKRKARRQRGRCRLEG